MKPFIWLFGGPWIKLGTKLSTEEFINRFTESIAKPYFLVLFGPTPILGKIQPNGHFCLHERCVCRNSGLPYFHGFVLPAHEGSVIMGSFTVHPITITIMILFLGMAFTFAAIGSFVAAGAWINGNANALWGLIAALVLLAGISTASIFSTVISKKKQQMYLNFFEEIFDAKLIEWKESN